MLSLFLPFLKKRLENDTNKFFFILADGVHPRHPDLVTAVSCLQILGRPSVIDSSTVKM